MKIAAQHLRAIRTMFQDLPQQTLPILSSTKLRLSRAALAATASADRSQRTAAVLIPLINVNDKGSILFTKRSQEVGTHKGQISFPGGHVEKGEGIVEAAIRETQEELGYDLSGKVQVLGRCGEIPSITGTPCYPVLGFLDIDVDNSVDLFFSDSNRAEVDHVFSRQIDELVAAEKMENITNSVTGFNYRAPCYDHDHLGRIWGLTAMICKPVLGQIAPLLTKVEKECCLDIYLGSWIIILVTLSKIPPILTFVIFFIVIETEKAGAFYFGLSTQPER